DTGFHPRFPGVMVGRPEPIEESPPDRTRPAGESRCPMPDWTSAPPSRRCMTLPATGSPPLTLWLAQAREGDVVAADAVLSAVYGPLKQLAHARLRRAGGGAFQTTELVHDAWLKLAGNQALAPVDRNHRMALAAQAMRQILVDHARQQMTEKHGAGAYRLTLTEAIPAAESAPLEVLQLDDLLRSLQALDPRAARMVEL